MKPVEDPVVGRERLQVQGLIGVVRADPLVVGATGPKQGAAHVFGLSPTQAHAVRGTEAQRVVVERHAEVSPGGDLALKKIPVDMAPGDRLPIGGEALPLPGPSSIRGPRHRGDLEEVHQAHPKELRTRIGRRNRHVRRVSDRDDLHRTHLVSGGTFSNELRRADGEAGL